MSKQELIQQLGEVRMMSSEMLAAGDESDENMQIHHAAGEALVRMLTKPVFNKSETIKDWQDVRITSGDIVLSGEATDTDMVIHEAAAESLIALLDPTIEWVD